MNLLRKIIIAGFQISSFLFGMILLLIFFLSFTEGTGLFFERITVVLGAHIHRDPDPFLEEMILVFFAYFGLIALCTVWISKDLAPDVAKLFSAPLGILREKFLIFARRGEKWFR
jgi:hypothetical protein